MRALLKTVVLNGRKRNFKNQEGEEIEFWALTLADSDNDYPMQVTIDSELAKHTIENPADAEQYIGKTCNLDIVISKFQGQTRLKVVDIQVAK
jgi:hypothetical protein